MHPFNSAKLLHKNAGQTFVHLPDLFSCMDARCFALLSNSNDRNYLLRFGTRQKEV